MIVDPPLLTVRRNFPRSDASILKALAGAQTGHVVDAMEGRGALDAAIKPVDRSRAYLKSHQQWSCQPEAHSADGRRNSAVAPK